MPWHPPAHMKALACVAIFDILCLPACTSTRDVTAEQPWHLRKGDILVLRQSSTYIDNPGADQLIPVGGREILPQDRSVTSPVPEGTRIKFLGAYAESGYMVDTHICAYGRILDGTFHGRRVGIDDLLSAGKDGVPCYTVSTNRPAAHP